MIDVKKKQGREETEQWLTPQDVARSLGFHIKTVQKYLREKKIKGYRFGLRWKIKESDLQAFIKQAGDGPPAE